MSRLALYLMGSFRATLDGTLLTRFASNKVRALLAYLAVEADRPASRETLAALLWPDLSQQTAMTYLRVALSNLREALGDRESSQPFLSVTHDSVQINASSEVSLDVRQFWELAGDLEAGQNSMDPAMLERLEQAIALCQGEFLEGFSIGNSAAFDEWASLMREQLHRQQLQALYRLAEGYERLGNLEKAISAARKQLELEPWREEAHYQLMRLLSLSGRRAEAVAQFEACRRSLRDELGIEPAEETVRLYERIRKQGLAEHAESKKLHNLPLQLTSFVGREKEIGQVDQLLDSSRLVTLTGAGGTGKTRLALHYASEALQRYSDGAWFADLAPLADPRLVIQAVARALGMRESYGQEALPILQYFLQARRLLLVLDNCEHLLQACARLAEALILECPNLSILATSREALGVPGEAIFHLPSLTLPEDQPNLPIETLVQYEAPRLFIERAQSASPGYDLTPENGPAIAEVCKRLEGVPLAIELAAARTNVLKTKEILARLEDRFRLLTQGSQAVLPRHQTLRNCIDWSYELLSPEEQAFFQRLSVFAGGWTLEAAESACSGDGIDGEAIRHLHQNLVNKSLVSSDRTHGGENRYRLQETIRQYAHEKLVGTGAAEQAHDRHLQYFMEVAEEVEWKIRGPDGSGILQHLKADQDNLHLALDWSIQGQERSSWSAAPGLRLGSALLWFWNSYGMHAKGLGWLERLLASESEEAEPRKSTRSRKLLRAKALFVAGMLANLLRENKKSADYLNESRKLSMDLAPEGQKIYALATLYQVEFDQLRYNANLEESLAIFKGLGDAWGEGECLSDLSYAAKNAHDYDQAWKYARESLDLHWAIGDEDGVARLLYMMGEYALEQEDFDRAQHYYEQSRDLSTKIGSEYLSCLVLLSYASLHQIRGQFSLAADRYTEALEIARRQGSDSVISKALGASGWLEMIQGDFERAAQLFEEELSFARMVDNKLLIAASLSDLGGLAWEKGDLEMAQRTYSETLAISQEIGEKLFEASAFLNLGVVALAQRDFDRVQAYLTDIFYLWKNSSIIDWQALELAAFLAAAQKQMARAARLLGATEHWHKKYIYNRSARARQAREAYRSSVQDTLGEQAFTSAFQEGQALTLAQASEYFL